MPSSPTPATVPVALFHQYAEQRSAALLKLASNWQAKVALDPRSPFAVQHARCINELAAQVQHLFELAGLLRLAGLPTEADQLDDATTRTWSQLMDTERSCRQLIITPPGPAPRPSATAPAPTSQSWVLS